MRKVIIIFIFLLSVCKTGYGQAQLTTSSVNAITYQQWANQDWEALIESGNSALAAGIDFYYLRYRLGIAWYEKKNFHKAGMHFNKAYQLNSGDDLLREYLYYSYVFSGREYEASFLDHGFTSGFKNRLNLQHNRSIKQAYIAYSYQPGASSSEISRFDFTSVPEGYQTISTGYHLLNIGLEHRVGSRVWLHHTFRHIQKNYFLYNNISDSGIRNPNDYIYLNQYYLGATTLIKPGLDVRFGFHYIHLLNYETTITSPPRPRTIRTSVTGYDLAGFLSVYHRFNYASAGLSTSIANLNNATQYQQNAIISLFPFGNLNFYTTSVISYQSEKKVNDQWRNQLILNQKLGLKLTGRVWAEADATFGDVLNVVSNDGSVIYNDPDVTKISYGLRLHTILSRSLTMLLDYRHLEKESNFVLSQISTQLPESIPYNTFSFSVTLLWNI